MKFRNQFDEHKHFYSVSGSPIIPKYKRVLNPKTGVYSIEKVGTKDLAEYINSFRDSTDLHIMLNLFAETGDPNVFNKVPEVASFDFTKVPNSLLEYKVMEQAASDAFYAMTPEQRSYYNNSVDQFIANNGVIPNLDKPVENIVPDVVDEGGVVNAESVA